MCANYIPASPEQLEQHFGVAPPDADYKDETYPGYLAPFIRKTRQDAQPGERSCSLGMFGLVLHWAAPKLARQTYNCRTETVSTKPSFRTAFSRGQFCIIPAETIFEPSYVTGKAIRHAVREVDGYPLGIAGIWDIKPAASANALPLRSFSMLTVNADGHAIFQPLHKSTDETRMGVLLQPDQCDAWLTCAPDDAPAFFTRYPAERLVSFAAPKGQRPAASDQGSLV